MNKQTTPYCPECGSTNLNFDATAVWDEDQGEFVFDELQGYDPTCSECGDQVECDWK